MVSQETYLFNDTLAQNILMARPDATEEQVNAAIDQASLTTFVENLPEGLKTNVGERGCGYPGTTST